MLLYTIHLCAPQRSHNFWLEIHKKYLLISCCISRLSQKEHFVVFNCIYPIETASKTPDWSFLYFWKRDLQAIFEKQEFVYNFHVAKMIFESKVNFFEKGNPFWLKWKKYQHSVTYSSKDSNSFIDPLLGKIDRNSKLSWPVFFKKFKTCKRWLVLRRLYADIIHFSFCYLLPNSLYSALNLFFV